MESANNILEIPPSSSSDQSYISHRLKNLANYSGLRLLSKDSYGNLPSTFKELFKLATDEPEARVIEGDYLTHFNAHEFLRAFQHHAKYRVEDVEPLAPRDLSTFEKIKEEYLKMNLDRVLNSKSSYTNEQLDECVKKMWDEHEGEVLKYLQALGVEISRVVTQRGEVCTDTQEAGVILLYSKFEHSANFALNSALAEYYLKKEPIIGNGAGGREVLFYALDAKETPAFLLDGLKTSFIKSDKPTQTLQLLKIACKNKDSSQQTEVKKGAKALGFRPREEILEDILTEAMKTIKALN